MDPRFKKKIVISFSIIGVSIIGFGVAFYFLYVDLTAQTKKIYADRVAIAERANIIDSLSSLKRDSVEADTYRAAINQLLIPESQLLDFPRWIDGLARVRQVQSSFSFSGDQTQAAADAPGHISFSLGAQGSLPNIIDFLKDVEFRSPRFLVELDSIDATKNGVDYRVSTNGRVFFK